MNRRIQDERYYKILTTIKSIWIPLTTLVALLIGIGVLKAERDYVLGEIRQNIVDHRDFNNRIIRLEDAVEQFPEIRKDIKDILRNVRNGNGHK